MCACSFVHGASGWKIASDLFTFSSVWTENNTEQQNRWRKKFDREIVAPYNQSENINRKQDRHIKEALS